MARERVAKDPKHTELEYKNQAATNGHEGHGITTKADAARASLKAGIEGPQDAVAYIKKTFGISMTPQHFSAVKTNENKRGDAPKGKPGRKPKSLTLEGYLTTPTKMILTGEGDLIEALEKMKPLITQFGADRVKRLVDLLD